VYRFLGKPWNDDEIKAIIRQCFERYDILQQNKGLIEQTRMQNEELRRLNDTLEEMVEERTRSLQHSQEILENLPVGVIGISREGIIVITNRAAQEIVSTLRLVLPGSDMDGNIPPGIKEAVLERMKDGSSCEVHQADWDGKPMKVYIKPLGKPGAVRGCLLMLDVKDSQI
jgi:nitrogen fixation/metabolism regulation signal transduction histidine kinase